MLTLVGLGLWDEKDIALRGIEAIKNADAVYAELYTSLWNGDMKKLEKIADKTITVLGRKGVEDNSAKIITEAKTKDVCLLVPGDPLAATTHADILLEAKKAGVNTKIIHASSIFTAAAECGLQLYKFGRTATIPLAGKTGGVLPESVYDAIKANLKNGLHTLLLLDIDVENGKNLSVEEGLEAIEKLDTEKMLAGKKLIVMEKVGSERQKTYYDASEVLLKIKFETPAAIIIPGNLHFTEEETLGFYRVK